MARRIGDGLVRFGTQVSPMGIMYGVHHRTHELAVFTGEEFYHLLESGKHAAYYLTGDPGRATRVQARYDRAAASA